MSFSSRRDRPPKTQAADVPTLTLAQTVPTLGRRLLAWSLEVSLFTVSAVGPLYLGGQVNQTVDTPRSPVAPLVQIGQTTLAEGFGISPRALPQQVPSLTNLLWSASVGLPVLLAIAHVYSLSRYGRSWPKQWLGVQVLALNGRMPGWRRTLMREAIGKWGGPLAVAYGVWKLSGAFPGLGLLAGLGTLALLGETLTGLGNRPRRPWHDWLAGTCVVDQETGAIIRLSSLWDEDIEETPPLSHPSLHWAEANGGLASVVLNPLEERWARPPLPSSRIGAGLGLLLVLGSLAGVGSYHLLRFSRASDVSEETLYITLVSTLTNPELDASARRAAVLALGNLPDDRVTPLLVDLIAQAEDPQWLDALQQALVARGSEAVPHLRRLNQSLAVDLTMQTDPAFRRTTIIRLQTVNRILTKLLMLERGDRPTSLDLSHLHLGHLQGGNGDFTLVLKNQNLAGIHWQGTILNRANLQGSRFYTWGNDQHPDTYDDQITDLSGADLTEANLAGADLTLSHLVNSSLLRTNLNRADLTLANLSRANLEQATLIQATLREAQLVEARLAKADLTEAQLPGANLEGARLLAVSAAGVYMPDTNLRGIIASAANFSDADLSHADLQNADLAEAQLQGANLQNANLRQASLRHADLRGIWLQGAVLDGADLAGALLTEPTASEHPGFVTAIPDLSTGDSFAGVDFTHTRNVSPEQLSFICTQGGLHPACDVSLPE